MKKTYMLFTFLFLAGLNYIDAQHHYRVKRVNQVSYLIPPDAKIAFEGIFNNKITLSYKKDSKFRYQYIIVQGLQSTDNYYSACEKVAKAKYFFSKNVETINFLHNYQITDKGTQTPHNSALVYYSDDRTVMVIAIDNDALQLNDPIINYYNLSIDLLALIAAREHEYRPQSEGIAQYIVEKVFELIPHPQQTALARFAYQSTTGKSFVLLNPKISMVVDSQEFHILIPGTPGNWNYSFAGQSIIDFYREHDGKIKQAPFIHFEYSARDALPNNVADVANSETLLTSSADLQLSSSTTNMTYMGLFQDYSKRNNAKSSRGSADYTHKSNDGDVFVGNSLLLLNNDLGILLTDHNDVRNVKASFASGKALNYKFGRGIITPIIYIWLDKTLFPVKLGSTLNILLQHFDPGRSYHLYRMHNGRYAEIKYCKADTFLLPGDKIIF